MSDQPQPLLITLRRGADPGLGPAGVNLIRAADRGGVGRNAGEHHSAVVSHAPVSHGLVGNTPQDGQVHKP